MRKSRPSSALIRSDSISFRTYVLVGAALIVGQALVLLAMGQPAICECGHIKLWHGIVSSPENSQHLTDWYTPSHVIHGFGFYFILWWFTRNSSMAIGARLVLAICLEVGWELLENTPLIIDRYRQSGLAQGYAGDSVINSMFDTLAMVLGFALARSMPVWATILLAVGMEAVTGYVIRDNLLLNIVQLVYPNDFISSWQLAK